MNAVILIESEYAQNIGYIARAMKNFGMHRLILVAPKVDHLSTDAISRAKHAKDILDDAEVVDYSYYETSSKESVFNDFETVIGTTSVLGDDYNIPRLPITPAQLSRNLRGSYALIIGRDGTGLRNEEIQRCNLIVTIPSSKAYPALNISHAVAVILYELHKHSEDRQGDHILLATQREKDEITKKISSILGKLPFQSDLKRETQREVWKNILNKNFLTKREAFGILGFFRKIDESIKKYK